MYDKCMEMCGDLVSVFYGFSAFSWFRDIHDILSYDGLVLNERYNTIQLM